MSNHEELHSLCSQHPDYESGSAYTRTKILCDVLTKLGRPIPSWMVLREHIGKGSSGDINRGVKDYRAEHAELLKRMDGLPIGIPENLAQPIRALWLSALEAAQKAFEQQKGILEAQRDAAAQTAMAAESARNEMAASLAAANEKAAGLLTALEQEREQSQLERAAREQAERMAERHIADLTEQRDTTIRALEANTLELRTLTARLEDERRRALMQVEQARQQIELARQQAYREGDQKLAKLEAQLRSEMAEQSLEEFRLKKQYADLEARHIRLKEKMKNQNDGINAKKKKPKTSPKPRWIKRHSNK